MPQLPGDRHCKQMDNGVEPKQTHMETLPVKLGLGPLWDMALWKFRFVVGQQTLNKEKQGYVSELAICDN